jgi:alpha-mannosidase
VLWLPDVFGYSAALPQILRKSGVDKFVTSKISWNETNMMPYDTFIERMKQMTTELKNSKLAKNAVKIYLPGEMEWDNKAKNEASGYLEITDAMAAGYMKLSKMTGVNINIEE